MKKSIKYFGLMLLVLLIFTTGCDKKDPEKMLKAAIKKTENLKSVKVKFNLNENVKMQGISMDMSFTGDEDVYMDNKDNMVAHGSYGMTMFGMNNSIENYIELKDGYIYTYNKDADSGWKYIKTEYKQENDYKDKMIEFFDDAKTVKSQKSDKKGYTKLLVTLASDKINTFYKELAPKELIEQLDKLISKDINFNVYLKDGYISIVEFDLSDMFEDVKSLFGEITEEYKDIDFTIKLTIEFSDFNNVSEFKIPDEVIKNAKEEKIDLDVDEIMNFNIFDESDTKVDI